MPPKENPKSVPARPANKKRPAAPDEESHRFVKRIAQHLREAAESPNTGDDFAWNEAYIAKAFDDAVENMPPGAVRDTLKAHCDVLRTLTVEMCFRPRAEDFPGVGEPGGPDDFEYHERKKPYREDFGNMSMAELVEETTRRLLKAKIEIPTQYRGDKTEVLNWEKGKEARLEKCVDAAWATTERWCDKTKTPDDSKTPETIEELSALMERIATHTASRVRLATDPASDEEVAKCVTEATHACAAKVVLIRHKFRRATPKERRPSRDRARTACHDAAQLCGDTRWRLVFQLAKEVPEDVGSAEATGANGGETKKKSRRNVVGKYGCNDRVLFDAALGLAGFDKEFELKVRSTLSHSTTLSLSLLLSRSFGFVCPPDFILRPYPRVALLSVRSLVFSRRETNVGFY